MKVFLAFGFTVVSLSGLSLKAEPVILGEYVEARTCDVWTGPCFANGEINLRGDNAILGWAVRKGSWDGVELKDLNMVAVLDAEGTLCTNAEGKVKTVLYIDERASEAEGKALVSLAANLAPKYLKDLLKIEKKKITYSRFGQEVSLEVGDAHGSPLDPGGKIEVKLKTKTLSRHCDSICGNEGSFYPSLSTISHIECAKTVENFYNGSALGLIWSDPNKRSAMLGQFSL